MGFCLGVLNLHPGAAAAQGALHEFREVHLGMEMRLVLAHEREADAAVLARRAFDLVEVYEATLSDWRERSEVRRLEHVAPGTWVSVSPALSQVLAIALEVARATDGAFDPTIGPLTELWREARRTNAPIDEARRRAALARVGHRNVEFDTLAGRVRFAVARVRLDLGAVAKGWILDRALESLVAGGAQAALVEAGGDLVVHGSPAGLEGWRVSVPRSGADTVLHLMSGAVSSSGSSVQRLTDSKGRVESHVMDPRTGRGEPGAEPITVVGTRGAVTDALATALSLTPPSRRAALTRRFGVRIVAP